MSAHQPIFPAKAIKLVQSRNLGEADALLADFAAAGLIKTYALMREIKPAGAGGPTEMVRDAQIPPEEWARIVASDKIGCALNGNTVRLAGSTFEGGMPSVQITGIRFSENSLVKVLDRYCANGSATATKQSPDSDTTISGSPSDSRNRDPDKKDVLPIMPGRLTASVAQAGQALGLSRTTIDKLMKEGTLHRKKVGRRTLITVESIERLIGANHAE